MGQTPHLEAYSRRRGATAGLFLAVSLAMGISCSPAWSQSAIDEEADTLLRAMSTYLGGLKTLTFSYDADHEIIDRQGQKLQYSASGTVAASRPDKLHVTRKGPYADVEATVNGKAISLYGRGLNVYAQMESPGTTIDAGVEEFRMSTGLDAAGADLLSADPYSVLSEGAEEGVVVGDAFIGGVACTHLAFRTPTVDWQIWVQKGEQPLPMKYVITTKWVTGAPQYSVRMTNWVVDGAVDQTVFDFAPPADAKKLEGISADIVGDITLEGVK